MNLPFDAASGHYNHGYAKLQHFHTGHRVTGLPNVGSKLKIPNVHCQQKSKQKVIIRVSTFFTTRMVYELTWEATFIMKMGEPGTSPWTCLNNALTSSSL